MDIEDDYDNDIGQYMDEESSYSEEDDQDYDAFNAY